MKQFLIIIGILIPINISAQTDVENIRKIYSNSLTNGKSYEWLDYLSNNIGARLSGSVGAERAVIYTKEELEKLGLDKVWLQPVMVPKWIRGLPEFAYIESKPGLTTHVNICALGGSVETPGGGVRAQVVEVQGIEALKTLSRDQVEGKIVFFNRAMQADLIDTFEA